MHEDNKTLLKAAAILTLCLVLLVSGCSKNDDISLKLFNTTTGTILSELSQATELKLTRFKTLKKDMDAYIYKCGVTDNLCVVLYRSSNVNALDVILNYNDADDNDFTLYAKCVGVLCMLLDESADMNTLINELHLSDFTQVSYSYETSFCRYEYNVSDERVIFSMYKQ